MPKQTPELIPKPILNKRSPARLLSQWQRLNRLPGGRWLFSRLIGVFVPYSGSIRAQVKELEPGHAVLQLTDRRRVRNHLHSIHAISLANLGELTSGLAMLAALPDSIQAIVVHIEIDYLKKARGLLTARSDTTLPNVSESISHPISAHIFDSSGETVAEIRVTWSLRPRD